MKVQVKTFSFLEKSCGVLGGGDIELNYRGDMKAGTS